MTKFSKSNRNFMKKIIKELLQHAYLIVDTLNIDLNNHRTKDIKLDLAHLLDSVVCVQHINNLSNNDSNQYFDSDIQSKMLKIINYLNSSKYSNKQIIKSSEYLINLAIKDIDPNYNTEITKSMK